MRRPPFHDHSWLDYRSDQGCFETATFRVRHHAQPRILSPRSKTKGESALQATQAVPFLRGEVEYSHCEMVSFDLKDSRLRDNKDSRGRDASHDVHGHS